MKAQLLVPRAGVRLPRLPSAEQIRELRLEDAELLAPGLAHDPEVVAPFLLVVPAGGPECFVAHLARQLRKGDAQGIREPVGDREGRLRLPRLEPGDLSDVDTSGLRQLGLRQRESGRPCSSC